MSNRDRKPGQPGRPRQAADKLRSERIRIRLSQGELAWLKEQAAGRPLPSWVRERLFGEPRVRSKVPAANLEVVGQLAKIGNNVNQLVRLAHTGRFPSHLQPLLRELYQMLARYQSELLGGPGLQ